MTKEAYIEQTDKRLRSCLDIYHDSIIELLERAWDEGRKSAELGAIRDAVNEALSRSIVGGRKGYGEEP